MAEEESERSHYYWFRNGRLTIRKVGMSEELLIDAWPEPAAVLRERWGAYSRRLLPAFRLLQPYRRPARRKAAGGAQTCAGTPRQIEFGFEASIRRPVREDTPMEERDWKKSAFDGFRRALPREVARAVEDFRSHQFAMIALLAHDPASSDLARSNPALAYLAAQWLKADRGRIRAAKPGSIPQRELLGLMGASSLQAAVNILKKTEPQSVHGSNWRQLLDVLTRHDDRQWKLLAHVPVVNEGVLGLVLDDRAGFVTPALLAEVSADKSARYRATAAAMLASSLELYAAMGENPPQRQYRTTGEVESALEEARRAFAAHQERAAQARQAQAEGRFPPPPLPRLPGKIEPLADRDALRREGEQQGNCVAGYARKVVLGQCHIYRVLWPQRATLSIIPGPTGEWIISELETAHNQPASAATIAFVKNWIGSHLTGI